MSYILSNPKVVWDLLLQHLSITGSALLVSVIIALPIGALISRFPRLATLILGVFGILYTIPSIALIILLIPFFGLNATSVVIALIIYSQVILLRNIVAGLNSVDPAVLEAARGMGMNAWQRWWRIQLPLAMPIMLAGLRVATVVCVGIATVGAKFSAGGLGRLLFDGIAQTGRYDKIWAGAISVGVLALVLNGLLLLIQREFDPATHIARAARRQKTAARLSTVSTPAHP